MAQFDLAVELAAIPALPLPDLRQRWTTLLDKPVPKVRRTLLALALAYELQALAHGGCSPALRRRLDQAGRALTRTRQAGPGMRLAREWNGVLHVVTVTDDGTICWNGETWRSLSEVARAITGTRWSGPAFFGLKHKVPGDKRAAA